MKNNIIFFSTVFFICAFAFLLIRLLDYLQNYSNSEFALRIYEHNLRAMWGSVKDDESYQESSFLFMHNTGNIPEVEYEIKFISFIDEDDYEDYYG